MKNPLKRSVSEDFWSEWRGSNSRPPHPKCGALSTALHPDSLFNCGRVSGQICGQKFSAEHKCGGKARKREKNGDFASFRRSAHEAVTRSQTSRASGCPTSVIILFVIRCAYRCRRMKCHDFRTPLLSYHNTRQKSSTNCKKAVYLMQTVRNTGRHPQNA